MSRTFVLCLPLLLSLAACSKKTVRPDDVVEVIPSPAAMEVEEPAAEAPAVGVARTAEPAPERPLVLPTLYFEFNSFNLSVEAREALDAFARDYRARGRPAKVVIEGHADERGTEEYNLVLGERRASAVRTYLSRLGLDAGALATVSYGESRPAKYGQGEAVWSANRRAEMVVKESR